MKNKAKRNKQPSSRPEGWLPAGYCVPIRPTVHQQQYSARAIGISRYVYNLCVATHRFCRQNRIKWPSWQDLQKALNAAKKDGHFLHPPKPDNPPQEPTFLKEVSKFVTEGAAKEFGKAIANWRNPNTKAGSPQFKKRRRTGSGSFLAASGVKTITYNGKRRITLPGLGSIKLAHTLPKGIIHEARISFRNGQWFLSVNYWKPPLPAPEPDDRIGAGAVDTGINPHATDSEGQTWENPKAYYQAGRKLGRWQRAQAHRKPDSRGWWEAQRKIDRLNRRVVGLRKNAQHQMSAQLVHKFQSLVIEDLNVAGMMHGKTPKAQADAGMGAIKRQVIYKGQWHHCQITLAPRFYPSSKRCSNCQIVNAKLKRERFWQCPACGVDHERNENAAVNLRDLLTLPADSGVMLRDGKALAVDALHGETGPDDRRTATQEFTPAKLTVQG